MLKHVTVRNEVAKTGVCGDGIDDIQKNLSASIVVRCCNYLEPF